MILFLKIEYIFNIRIDRVTSIIYLLFILASKTNPQLNNLPATISFAENTAVDTALFTVTVEDPDALDVHTYSMIVYPKTASAAFSLDANGNCGLFLIFYKLLWLFFG
jgi:hypothetical protein